MRMARREDALSIIGDTMSENEPVTTAESVDAENAEPVEVNETETDQSPEETEAETAPAEEPEKPDPAQRKIAELAFKEREARRERDRLLKILERQSSAETPKPKPKLEDFDTLDDYLEARDEWRDTASKKETQAETDTTPVIDDYSRDAMYQAGMQKYPDFDEVVGAEHVPITPFMANAVLTIDDEAKQADVAYHLATHLKEAQRISRLAPEKQIAEVVRLEMKLSTKPVKKVSTAPKPMTPVKGSATSNDELSPNDDMAEFIRKRNKQLGRI